jgi:ribose-phosphate pyrophosphokinase
MNLKLRVGGVGTTVNAEVTKTIFPAQESCIRIVGNPQGFVEWAEITFHFRSNSDLFDLALLVDAVRRHYVDCKSITLKMPYLPYAQQDRVCNQGESLSIKVVADFINSLGFSRVICNDIHSNVGAALINNLVHIDLAQTAWKLYYFVLPDNTTLVSPDDGATKKVVDFAKYYGYTEVVRGSKRRDMKTGNIVSTEVLDVIPACENLLIVDDLCIGGRTFIELVKALKISDSYQGQPISLYVTHGIFSAGLEVFEGHIDKIYVHNLMNDAYKDHPLIQVI